MAHREQFIQSRSNKAGVHFGEVLFAFSPQRKQAGSKPPKWYWWRSQFSCLASNEFKLRVSIIFDFATSTKNGHEAHYGSMTTFSHIMLSFGGIFSHFLHGKT